MSSTDEDWAATGTPYIVNYDPKDYKEHFQNWQIIRDDRGVLYTANGNGILEYDGYQWQLIETKNYNRGRSFAKGDNGVIYVGASNDFGYLAPDSLGRMTFVSLIEQIPEEKREMGEVWRTHAAPEGVYFQTFDELFFWNGEDFKYWSVDARFFLSYLIDGTFYIQERGKGLLRMEGESLQFIPGSGKIAEGPIHIILPFSANEILVCSGRQGLHILRDGVVSKFPNEVDAFINHFGLSGGVVLPSGLFAFSTYSGGVIVMDRQGKRIKILNKSSGLISEDVKSLYVDEDGTLWLAMNSGFAQVRFPSPFTFYGENEGLLGNVEDLLLYDDKLYATTSQGIYYSTLSTGNENRSTDPEKWHVNSRFYPVSGINAQSFYLLVTARGLVAGTNVGLYRVDNTRATLIDNTDDTYFSLYQHADFPEILFAGAQTGLEAFQYRNTAWQRLGNLPDIEAEIRHIEADKNGRLWLGTMDEGIYRVTFQGNGKNPLNAKVEKFDDPNKLMTGQLTKINGEIYFASETGIRTFDETSKLLVLNEGLGKELADPKVMVSRLFSFSNDRIIAKVFDGKDDVYWLANASASGDYTIDRSFFNNLLNIGSFHTAFHRNNISWLGMNNGIARYNPGIAYQYDRIYPPLIRSVRIVPEDSLVYGGSEPEIFNTPELPYELNSFRFEFAMPAFEVLAANEYQFFLEGYDKGWSVWQKENRKDYTNLPEGDYIFKVRGRDLHRQESEVSQFLFRVLPPWYRSWWAYLLYVLLIGAAIFAIVKIRVRQLETYRKNLENIVAERTAEVVAQRNRLKEQSEKLTEMDRVKTRFFANISHEFRTPLTLILGLLNKYHQSKEMHPSQDEYGAMQRNATRLLLLINQLLDIAKLEAGGMKLRAAKGDIVLFLRRIFASFASMGEQKKIKLTFNGAPISAETGYSKINLYFDTEKFEKIFYNLLSNAFKFTNNAGTIAVNVVVSTVEDESPENVEGRQFVVIQVRNTGAGIPGEKLPYIFDRFYQAQDSNTYETEGTGIGLALVKELVELHQGSISVNSEIDSETVFSIKVPLGNGHLHPDQIVTAEDEGATSTAAEIYHESISEKPTAAKEEEPAETLADAVDEDLILVVEDHRDLRDFIRQHLLPSYKVIEAENGRIGLEKAKTEVPDLIISDVMMPEMDGYALGKALKASDKTNHIPFILLTAKAERKDRMEGLETGADDYLIKPFDPDELLVRVRNLIKLRNQLREKYSTEMFLKPRQVSVPSVHQQFLEKMNEILEENLENEDFSVEKLGDAMGMSRVQLHRKIRALADKSPSEFIRSFRLLRAADLLKQEAGNIAEIAYMVGFNSQSYFTRCFQEEFGCSPSEFKKQQH